jgi:hypothetical protein
MAWIALGLIAACAVAVRSIPPASDACEELEPFYWLAMIISLILVYGIFHHAEFNTRRDWHGFPYRLFTLPVRTWALVAVPMVLGTLAVQLTYWMWAWLVFTPLSRSCISWVAAVIGVGLLCHQAIVWGLAGFRLTRMVVLSVVGMGLMLVASLPEFVPVLGWAEKKTFLLAKGGLAVVALSAVAVAWCSVESQRRGGGRGRGWWTTQAVRLLDALPRRHRPFASSGAAQFWFEWRRVGWMLPLFVAVAIVLALGPYSWFLRDDHDCVGLIMGWLLGLPVGLSLLVSAEVGKTGFGPGDLSLPPFLAVRPLASGEMVIAKMKVAALSAAMAWALVILFLGLWMPLWANHGDLAHGWHQLVIWWGPARTWTIAAMLPAVLAILTWANLVGSLWPMLTGSKKVCAVAGIVLLACLGSGLGAIVYWVKHFDIERLEQYVAWLGWGLSAVVLIKLWLAVFSWQRISAARIWRFALLWLAATGLGVALVMLAFPSAFWLRHLAILSALASIPLARLGLAVRALEANRHR